MHEEEERLTRAQQRRAGREKRLLGAVAAIKPVALEHEPELLWRFSRAGV